MAQVYHRMRRGALGRTRLGALIGVCLAAAACGSPDIAAPTGATADRGAAGGHYKVGNPYQINGVWYTPEEDFHYDERGLASWYGPGFHGNQTANGEIFDQDALTAAHPTLQMPSLVRVTNLDNGRSVVLRINDRGPFVGGRIIDVSRRAAQLLGFAQAGVAEVQVQVLTAESRELASRYGRGGGVVVASAAPPEREVDHEELQRIAAAARGARPAAAPAAPAPAAGPVFIHAGSFPDIAGARRLVGTLSPIDRGTIVETTAGGVATYQVQLGPYASADQASRVLSQVVGAGHANARLVR